MKRFLLLLCSFSIAGCAIATRTYGPDGSESYAINCTGTPGGWGDCYAKAGEKCGSRGYEILSRDGDSQSSIAGNNLGVYGSQSTNRSLLVKCK